MHRCTARHPEAILHVVEPALTLEEVADNDETHDIVIVLADIVSRPDELRCDEDENEKEEGDPDGPVQACQSVGCYLRPSPKISRRAKVFAKCHRQLPTIIEQGAT